MTRIMHRYIVFSWIVVFLFDVSDCQLYDFGPDVNDDQVVLLRSVNLTGIDLFHPIQYFGMNYSKVYVSGFGVVGFNREISFLKQQWRDNPEEGNYPFIAPFYFDVFSGDLNYRLTQGQDTFLEELGAYIKTGVVGVAVEDFLPDIAIIATWHNVTDAISANDDIEDEEQTIIKTNTFQVVIVASSKQTFVIFNYKKMDVPDKPYYQAGMNGGLNRGWLDVYDTYPDINQFPQIRASDVPGRFIYKVSDDVIVRGGCIQNDKENGKLVVSPQLVSSFGGEIVDVSGLCVTNRSAVHCQFDVMEPVRGIYFSPMLIKCMVPRLNVRGLTKLKVLVENKTTLETDINVVLPGRSSALKHLTLSLGWNETDTQRLSITWDHEVLSKNPAATVDILLIGYREDEKRMIYKILKTLATRINNSDGVYTFVTADHHCEGEDCELFEIGLVEVRLNEQYLTLSSKYRYFTSYAQPLGWFVVSHMTNTYGTNWSMLKCNKWYEDDKVELEWQEELLDCPCTLQQALTDFGRWQPDMGCNIFTGSKCTYHIGAVHCVRSFKPTVSGSGNQCCYGPDGGVRYAADSFQGSTPDRSHDWGSPPFNKPGYVPSLSHWKHDVVSFYYCCLWVDYKYCDYYMDERATRDCKNYNPPKTAIVFGDPHIITFDGFSYDAMDRGDYWLTKSGVFELQGRFDYISVSQLSMVLTGVVFRSNDSSTVEIHFSSADSSSTDVLTVLVDGDPIHLDTVERSWLDIKGLTIINSALEDGLHEHFTVLMPTGVGVQVEALNNLLHVTVVMPQAFKNETMGLLGSWSESIRDTLQRRDGSLISRNAAASNQIAEEFIRTWIVEQDERLFKYDWNVQRHLQPLVSQTRQESEINALCGENNLNSSCHHDYRSTGRSDIANATLHAETWFTAVQGFQIPVASCGLLDVPRSEKSNYNYSLGSEVTITSCRVGELSGETTYTCTADHGGIYLWVPDVTATCEAGKITITPGDGNINTANGLFQVTGLQAVFIVLIVITSYYSLY